jgi:hypothetical protein
MVRTGPTEACREQLNVRLVALLRVQGLLSRADRDPLTVGALVELHGRAGEPRREGRLSLVVIRRALVYTLARAIHDLARTPAEGL